MSWPLQALIAALVGTSLLALVYWYLHVEYRERALALWAWGWSLQALRYIFLIFGIISGEPYQVLLSILSQLSLLGSAMLVLRGTQVFVQRPSSQFWNALALAGGLWVLAAPLAPWSFYVRAFPASLIFCAISTLTGIVILKTRNFNGLGRLLTGWSFILYGLNVADFPFLGRIEWLAPYENLSTAMLGLVAAMGVILIYFDKVRSGLAQSENRYRLLFNRAIDSIFISSVSPEGQPGPFLEVNEAACRSLGYSREEMLTLTPPDIFAMDQCPFDDEVWEVLCERRQVLFENVQKSKKGTPRPVEVHAHLFDLNGTPTMMAIARDISERKKAEQELRDSEERYRRLFKDSPLPMWVYDKQTLAFLAVNNAAVTAYGYSRDEFLDMTIRDIRPPEAIAEMLRNLETVPGKLRKAGTWQHRWKDGTVREVEITTHDFAFDGRPARLVLANDVTEHKLAMKLLQKSEERLRAFFDSGVVGTLFANLNGDITEANDKFLHMIGYTREDLQAGKLKWTEITPPEFRSLDREKIAEARQTGACSPFEKQYIRKDGTKIWVLLGFVLIGDRQEEAVAFVLDQTERKRTDESDRRSRSLSAALSASTLSYLQSGDLSEMAQILIDRCRMITDAKFGLIFDLDTEGNARFLAVAGLNRKTAPQRALHDRMVSQRQEEGFFCLPRSDNLAFAPILQGRTILTNSPQGHSFWRGNIPEEHPAIESFLGTPLKVGRKVVGMIGLINRPGGFTEREQREVESFAHTAALAIQSARTELARNQAEEFLRQAQKMEAVGQLAGGVAHDFNNLLTVINGYSTMVLRTLKPGGPHHHEIERILEAGERAAALTRQLLAFSRRQVLEPKVLETNDLVRKFDKILRRLVRENITLTLSLGDNLGRIKADPGQIEQIIMNLVVNACDALPQGGEITIDTSNVDLDQHFANTHRGATPGPYVRLAIRDAGIGMTEETRQKIFEPFFTTKEQGRGTGLGLATVYGIVKQSGGYIVVTSDVGKGSTFEIFLPRTEEPLHPPSVARKPEFHPPLQTVLVVEDDQQVLDLTVTILQTHGFLVIEARNPEAAQLLFEKHAGEIDILLSDVIMPGMNGFQLAAKLRRKQPGLKVLFMSGYAEIEGEVSMLHEPNTDFIQKPFSAQALLDKTQHVLFD